MFLFFLRLLEGAGSPFARGCVRTNDTDGLGSESRIRDQPYLSLTHSLPLPDCLTLFLAFSPPPKWMMASCFLSSCWTSWMSWERSMKSAEVVSMRLGSVMRTWSCWLAAAVVARRCATAETRAVGLSRRRSIVRWQAAKEDQGRRTKEEETKHCGKKTNQPRMSRNPIKVWSRG